MTDNRLELVFKGGQVVTREGIRTLAIGVKNGKIAALAPDEGLLTAPRIIDAT